MQEKRNNSLCKLAFWSGFCSWHTDMSRNHFRKQACKKNSCFFMAIVKCEKNLFYVNIIKIWFGDAFLHSHIFSQNIKIRSNTLFVNQLQLKLTYLKNNFGTSEYFDALLGLKLKKIRTSGWYKIRIHLLFTAMTVKQRVIHIRTNFDFII